MGYDDSLICIEETEEYASWLAKLRDRKARMRIENRIDRLRLGNPGDVAPVGEGVSELHRLWTGISRVLPATRT